MSVQRWSLVAGVALAAVGLVAFATSQAQQPTKPGDKPAAGQPSPGGAPAGPAAKKMPTPLVAVADVVQQNVEGEHTFVGSIMPKRISSIGSAVDGRVIDFPLNEGEPVKKGDTLAQLLTGQLDIQLAGAKAQLELEKAALEELKASWPEEVKQAEARLYARKAAYDYTASRQQRARSLHKQGTITDEMLHDAESQHDQANQAFTEAKSALAVVQGPRRLAIDQAEHKVVVQQETANAIEDQIIKHTIRSPFDGYVVKEFTEVGEWVAKAGMVAMVAELDEVDVEIMVVENYLPSLSIGMNATVEVPALPRDAVSGGKFTGQIVHIVPQADARSRSFPVKVRLKNSLRQDGQLLLKAGMLARVTLPVSSAAEAVLVPKDAVVLGGPTPVVFAVDNPPPDAADPALADAGIVRRVAIELGVEQGNWIQAKGDIRAGDRVVVQGNERLRPGMTVNVAPRGNR